MAYLQDSGHDVVISYAHADNISYREGKKLWVEQFVRQLTERLRQYLGVEVDVWHDQRLGRAQIFDSVIEGAVRGCGVLISLISNSYLRSDYCKQEIKLFRDKAQAEPHGLVVNKYSRIFPVLLQNIPSAEWQELSERQLGFEFHDSEGDKLGKPLDPASTGFEAEMGALVEDLGTVLKLLKDQEKRDERPPPEGPLGRLVFLAEVTDDLDGHRRKIREELKDKGFAVVPHIPLDPSEKKYSEAVAAAIREADLSVHLLGPLAGKRAYPGNEESYPLVNLRIACEHASLQLVVTDQELGINNKDEDFYHKKLAELESDQRDYLTRISARKTKMPDIVLEAIPKLLPEGGNGDGDPATVVLDVIQEDVAETVPLTKHLVDNECTVIMIRGGKGPTDQNRLPIHDFADRLRQAQLYIAVYGKIDLPRVASRVAKAVHLKIAGRMSTLVIVYLARPPKPRKDFPREYVDDVIDGTEGFDPKPFDRLLRQVRAP